MLYRRCKLVGSKFVHATHPYVVVDIRACSTPDPEPNQNLLYILLLYARRTNILIPFDCLSFPFAEYSLVPLPLLFAAYFSGCLMHLLWSHSSAAPTRTPQIDFHVHRVPKNAHTHAYSRARDHTRSIVTSFRDAMHLAGSYPFAVSFLVASVRYSFILNVTFHIYGYGGTLTSAI